MKQTKRKAFNFLRSYFDVINELPKDCDKLSFLMSIINKQFLNEDPEDLNFIAKLCYESQRHSIESSVKGWIRANKTDLQGNLLDTPTTNPPTDPPTDHKEEEEKEQVEVEEEVKTKEVLQKINFSDLLIFINSTLGKKYKVVNKAVQQKYNARLKDGYTKEDFKSAIINAAKDQYHKETNFKYLTIEYFSRSRTLDLHCGPSEIRKEHKIDLNQRYV
jgi:uncharacterized phage protein (TIGR02220 family)